eukprot:2110582-Prymnesium_polylepis.1
MVGVCQGARLLEPRHVERVLHQPVELVASGERHRNALAHLFYPRVRGRVRVELRARELQSAEDTIERRAHLPDVEQGGGGATVSERANERAQNGPIAVQGCGVSRVWYLVAESRHEEVPRVCPLSQLLVVPSVGLRLRLRLLFLRLPLRPLAEVDGPNVALQRVAEQLARDERH